MKRFKQAAGVSTMLAFGLGLAMLLGCNLKKLPACDDPQVKNLAKQALTDAPAFKGKFMNFQLGIGGETRYATKPKPKRVCRTTLTSKVGTETMFYSVEWQDQKKGIIWVQVMGPKDNGT